MGYETRFLLTHNSEVELDPIDASYYHIDYGKETEGIKWYDHHTDMLAHSAKYPDVTFTLSGDGKETGDIWRARYLGGKVIEEKRASNIFGFETLTRQKIEAEIARQLTGVFSPDDVEFALNGVKRAFDKLGVE